MGRRGGEEERVRSWRGGGRNRGKEGKRERGKDRRGSKRGEVWRKGEGKKIV